MKIELMGYQVLEAIALYTKEKVGVEIEADLECHLHVDISEWKPQYLKDANDKYGYLRDEKGHAVLDDNQRHFVDHTLPFGEMDTLSFYVKGVINE